MSQGITRKGLRTDGAILIIAALLVGILWHDGVGRVMLGYALAHIVLSFRVKE